MCKRTTMLALTLLALLGAAPLLGACHTTAGAGEDISKTGQAIEDSANKHAPLTADPIMGEHSP
jgi:predicted small secreted protein